MIHTVSAHFGDHHPCIRAFGEKLESTPKSRETARGFGDIFNHIPALAIFYHTCAYFHCVALLKMRDKELHRCLEGVLPSCLDKRVTLSPSECHQCGDTRRNHMGNNAQDPHGQRTHECTLPNMFSCTQERSQRRAHLRLSGLE